MASFCFLREHGRTAKMPFANERVAVSKNADEDIALMACGIIAPSRFVLGGFFMQSPVVRPGE